MLSTIPKTLRHFDLAKHLGQEIVSYGRISRIVKRAEFWFLKLRTADSCDDFTVVITKKLLPKPTTYSTLYFRGIVHKSPDEKSFEIVASEVLFYGPFLAPDLEVAFGMAPHLLRQKESQRLLTRQYQAQMWIYQRVEEYLHQVSKELGLLRVRVPLITFSDCEGGGEIFEVRSQIPGFFKQSAYLSVSGQVDEETITSRFLCPTYSFSPSFRSDPSQTQWHACEFYHYEPEIPFITLEGLMKQQEVTLKGVIKYLLSDTEAVDRLTHLRPDITQLQQFIEAPFASISYTDAVKVLQESKHLFKTEVEWGRDFHKEHERYLCETHFKVPTFVYRYPISFKSFYMQISLDEHQPQSLPLDVSSSASANDSVGVGVSASKSVDRELVCESVDLLVPGIGELCGGSLREHNLDTLIKNMKKKGLKLEDYEEYIRLRREGTFPHGGYGLGFDRLIMFITGAQSIRDICPFPRYYEKAVSSQSTDT